MKNQNYWMQINNANDHAFALLTISNQKGTSEKKVITYQNKEGRHYTVEIEEGEDVNTRFAETAAVEIADTLINHVNEVTLTGYFSDGAESVVVERVKETNQGELKGLVLEIMNQLMSNQKPSTSDQLRIQLNRK